MKNILIIITCLKPHGAEYSCLRHIKEYKKKFKINFTLITIIGGELENEFRELNIPIINLSENIKIKNLNYLFKTIFSKRYDLIHTWMYHANVLGLLISIFSRVSVITSIRQALPNYSSLKIRTILIALIDSFLSRFIAKNIVFNSRISIIDHSNRLFFSRKKSIYIPNKPYLIPFKSNIKVKGNKLRFISLARDDKSKNLNYMVDLFNSIKYSQDEIILDIYGENIENSKCKELYEQLIKKNRIRFYPKIKNIDSILHKYDFYISTSLWEGYPNSLITAASSGCIPIATNAGDSWDLLGGNIFKLQNNINDDLKIISEAIIFNKNNIREERSKATINFIERNYKNSAKFSDIYFTK